MSALGRLSQEDHEFQASLTLSQKQNFFFFWWYWGLNSAYTLSHSTNPFL
jgi:hypothetical protein